MSAAQQTDEITDLFIDFYRNYYREEIGKLAQSYPNDRRSLYIKSSDLYTFDPNLFNDWQDHPDRIREYAEEALGLFDLPADISLDDAHVRLTDSDGYLENQLSVRDVRAKHIGKYVAVSGILGKVTATRPRVVEAAFECQRCGTITRVPQSDRGFQEPHECHGCERQGPFKVLFDQSEWIDARKLKIEELPEETSGASGHSLLATVDDDLCDVGGVNGLTDCAGERVTIIAKVRVDTSMMQGRNPTPEGEPWLAAEAIVFDSDEYSDLDVEKHLPAIREFIDAGDPVEQLSKSIAPELLVDEELETVMEACVAWLFNGYRIDPKDGGQKRGDIHMTIMGDPGVGKSTLLTNLEDISPKCEFRSGTGVSKVGLTASAIQEEFDGKSEWTLEPGVLPRSNGGHCIIDEVDDVVDEKTKALHDALEGDQMVKVDKAGISANLPTRTAVLAVGNPKYGKFTHAEPFYEQIDMDPALISRMDLLYSLEDKLDRAIDDEKAGHILDSFDELSRKEVADRLGTTSDKVSAADETPEGVTDAPIPREVFKAWVAYARENVFPLLTSEAKSVLREFYTVARNANGGYEN